MLLPRLASWTPRPAHVAVTLAAVVAGLVAWAALLLLHYLLRAHVLPRLRHRARPAYVAVLGSGLEDGRLPDQLVRRMDVAIARWRSLHAADPAVRLVLSGGTAPGQPRSEAAAMADHATAHGVPASALVLEDRSRTTEENIAFTRDVVGRVLGPAATGLLVTSGYHVVRAADLARSAHLAVRMVGAPARGLPWRRVWTHEVTMILGRHPAVHAVLALAVGVGIPLWLVLRPA